MPRYANIRTTRLHNLLLRMGFTETTRNHHRNYRHPGLDLRTRVSFGNNEIDAPTMGEIITRRLCMTVDESLEAMDWNITERFTDPNFWNN